MTNAAQIWLAGGDLRSENQQRDAVDRVARSWIGTPYHDLGEVKGVGTDCGKLIKCVFVEAGIIADFAIAEYSPQHFLHQHEEQYLGYVTRFAREIAAQNVRPGDVVLYRVGNCFAHGGIVIKPGWPSIVHAHGISRVVRRASGTAIHLGAPITAIKFFSAW